MELKRMSDVLLIDTKDGVRRLTMNRPDKLNALNNELTEALLEALLRADEDPAVGAVVLTGNGRAFCPGADFAEIKGMSEDMAAGARRGELTMRLHAAFVQISVPVICAVNGLALGGGCGLAIAGDLAIAAESASFGYPEIKIGAVAAIVMANLVRMTGRKMAYEMVALGERISAPRALSIGLINRVVLDTELLPAATAMATTIAGHARHAQRSAKRLFSRVADTRLLDALEIGRDANTIMRGHTIRSEL
jgi:enoyl-CoA hydratase/carnithine racemase